MASSLEDPGFLMADNTTPSSSATLETSDSSSHPSLIPLAVAQHTSLQKWSCLQCKHRKVKCDRRDPCSGCIKSRAECVFREPPRPRRRTRKPSPDVHHVDTGAARELAQGSEPRIASHDSVVREDRHGGGATRVAGTDDMEGPSFAVLETARMVVGHGMTRYIGNNLFADISDEVSLFLEHFRMDLLNTLCPNVMAKFGTPFEMMRGFKISDEDELSAAKPNHEIRRDGGDLILGSRNSVSLRAYHPNQANIAKLWQIFLDNVDPLIKIFHVPSMQEAYFEGTRNVENLSKSMEGLAFAIYSLAVTALSDDECHDMLGEEKQILLNRYHWATQNALINMGFLRGANMLNLQAFVLFLLSAHNCYTIHTLWIFTGIAVRIGQRMGLHRDGAPLKFSSLEVELRRRLWWQIVLLDSRTAEVTGSAVSVAVNVWDTKLPLNVNDQDLRADTVETLDLEHKGATEMIYCLLRFQLGEFFRQSGSMSAIGGMYQKLSNEHIPLTTKDKIVEELKETLENQFLRYCDPLVPLHFLSAIMTRAAIYKMRFIAHHPRQYADKSAIPQAEKEMLFSTTIQILEYENLIRSTASMKRFLWHFHSQFHWDVMAYLLSELRIRTTGDEVIRAWHQVGAVFDHFPELITKINFALYVAIGNLALRGWTAHEEEMTRHDPLFARKPLPNFILALRAQRHARAIAKLKRPGSANAPIQIPDQREVQLQGEPQSQDPGMLPIPTNIDSGIDMLFTFDPLPMDLDDMDWQMWDDLLQQGDLDTHF